MAKGIMLVQSRPSSPEEAGAYHSWYDDVHLPEALGVDGFVSARRLQAFDGDSFLVVYEVDDVDAAKAALAAFQSSGNMTRPIGVEIDPPPTVQWFQEFTA